MTSSRPIRNKLAIGANSQFTSTLLTLGPNPPIPSSSSVLFVTDHGEACYRRPLDLAFALAGALALLLALRGGSYSS